jgi:hypothetical protein
MGVLLIVPLILASLTRSGADARDVLCPADSGKKPQLIYTSHSKVQLFACGDIDENRMPREKLRRDREPVLMTRMSVYGFKNDGSPTPLFENDSDLRTFRVFVRNSGIEADELIAVGRKPAALFATVFSCDKKPCAAHVRCLRPFPNAQSVSISKKTLTDPSNAAAAEDHLRSIFRAGISGNSSSRRLFKSERLKDQLDGSLRDQYERYEEILKSYADLGC